MKSWQLQQAKAKLSKVVKDALSDGPQAISLYGKPVVIVLSKKAYDKLIKPKLSFVQFMLQSPWSAVKIYIKRDRSLTRKTE